MNIGDLMYYLEPGVFTPMSQVNGLTTYGMEETAVLGYYANCKGNEEIVENVLNSPFAFQTCMFSWVRCLEVLSRFLCISTNSNAFHSVELIIAFQACPYIQRGSAWDLLITEMECALLQVITRGNDELSSMNSLKSLQLVLLYLLNTYLDKLTVSNMCCYDDNCYAGLATGIELSTKTKLIVENANAFYCSYKELLQALRLIIVLMNESDNEVESQKHIYKSIIGWFRDMSSFLLSLPIPKGVAGITSMSKHAVELYHDNEKNSSMRFMWTSLLKKPAVTSAINSRQLMHILANNSDMKILYNILYVGNGVSDYSACTMIPLMQVFDLFYDQCLKWNVRVNKRSIDDGEKKERSLIMCRFVTTLNEFERSGVLTVVTSKQKDNLFKSMMTWL